MKKSNYLVLFIFLLLTPSLATAMLSSETAEIPYQINNSDRIVIGTVSEIHTYDTYTIYTITVKEWLYNPLPVDIIKVESKIGTNLRVEDEVEFTLHESVLLMIKDVNLNKQLSDVTFGFPGKYPVSDRDAVIKELKAQGKWKGEDQTGNKPLNELSQTTSISSSIALYTYEDLSNNSETIVIGTVKEILPSKYGNKISKNTDFGPDHVIYTDIIISVDKYLKNPLSSKEIGVRVADGTVGNDTLTMDDEPCFKTGENVLLYLTKDASPATQDIGPNHFVVTGLLQGKYTLTDDGKVTRPDENTTLDELLSTINQTENKTNNTEMTANTGTVGKQEGKPNSTHKSNSTPFINSFWVLVVVFGAVTYIRKPK